MKRPCDVCGKPDARLLSAADRLIWPCVAAWVAKACDECRGRFERNAERGKTTA